MNVTYCTGHERSSPHCWRIRSRSSGRAPDSAIISAGSPVSRTMRKIVALRMRSVTMLYSARRMMNCPIRLLRLQLDVFPRIGVAGRDRGEDVLPLLRRDLRADRVDERMPEHGHEVVVLQDRALDL